METVIGIEYLRMIKHLNSADAHWCQAC